MIKPFKITGNPILKPSTGNKIKWGEKKLKLSPYTIFYIAT